MHKFKGSGESGDHTSVKTKCVYCRLRSYINHPLKINQAVVPATSCCLSSVEIISCMRKESHVQALFFKVSEVNPVSLADFMMFLQNDLSVICCKTAQIGHMKKGKECVCLVKSSQLPQYPYVHTLPYPPWPFSNPKNKVCTRFIVFTLTT